MNVNDKSGGERAKCRIQLFIHELVTTTTSADDASSATKEAISLSPKAEGSLLKKMIDNFISCTLLSIESANVRQIQLRATSNPQIVRVFKNIKQFLSGAKNYLVKTGEGSFHKLVQEEREKVTHVSQQLCITNFRCKLVIQFCSSSTLRLCAV